MRPCAASIIVACLFVANISGANSQTASNCTNALPLTASCTNNSNFTPIPSNLDGTRLAVPGCANALIYAIASLYSYDDLTCYPSAGTPVGASAFQLKFVQDAIDALNANERKRVSQDSNFRATLYCHTQSNTLILAFRGSLSIVPPLGDLTSFFDWVNDWLGTNVLMHLGPRPAQYEFAQDTADDVERLWSLGAFDQICGPGRPKLVLTGHSKGGGQAQYAAVPFNLDAIVFNSDLVNPTISREWLLGRYVPEFVRTLVAFVYGLQSICGGGHSDSKMKQYADYLKTDRIKDIRMANDRLVKLLSLCDLPHAKIGWLEDTLTCPDADGHAITTVIRALQVCTGHNP
jgi:hypothetical protein